MTIAMKFEIRDPKWAEEIQSGLEEYMMSLYDSVDAENGEEVETESGLPYCACNVCEYREILSFVAPRIIKGYLDQKIGFVDTEDL